MGVPVVMGCAVGAAGMAITIHGSLEKTCTQWTHMREAEERSVEEVKKSSRINGGSKSQSKKSRSRTH